MTMLSGTSLVLIDRLTDTGTLGLPAVNDIVTAVINGVTYVYSCGSGDSAIQVSILSADGLLTPIATITHTPGTTLSGILGLENFEVAGNAFLAVTGLNNYGVTTFSLSGSSPYVTIADSVFDSNNFALNLDGTWEL